MKYWEMKDGFSLYVPKEPHYNWRVISLKETYFLSEKGDREMEESLSVPRDFHIAGVLKAFAGQYQNSITQKYF